MKVILLQEVPRLGKLGAKVNVAEGYFRNYLRPRNIAIEATPGNEKEFEKRRKMIETAEVKEKGEAQELAAKLALVTLPLRLKAGENDRLFGSVTNSEISAKLKEQGFDVDRKKIHLAEPIKSLGEFTVDVKLHAEVIAPLKIIVSKEE